MSNPKLATKQETPSTCALRLRILTALHESIACNEPLPAVHQRLWHLREAAWLDHPRRDTIGFSRYTFNAAFTQRLRAACESIGLRVQHTESIVQGIRAYGDSQRKSASTKSTKSLLSPPSKHHHE